jgi:Macro domain
VWRGGEHRERELLASCYRRSLQEAQAVGARTVAFPAISTGVYGFPKPEAARIAVETLLAADATGIDEVILVAHDPETAELYGLLLEPSSDDPDANSVLTGDQSGAASSTGGGLSGRKRLALVVSSTVLIGLRLGVPDWLRPERLLSLLAGLVCGLIMGIYMAAPRFGWFDRLIQTGTDFSAASAWRWPGLGARRMYEMVTVFVGIYTLVVWLIKGEVPSPFTLLWVPLMWGVVAVGIRVGRREASRQQPRVSPLR